MTRPDAARLLITGRSQSGKTRTTARLLQGWLDRHGPHDVLVLDFAPERTQGARIWGRRITRFIALPPHVVHVEVPARAPRLEGRNAQEAMRLAEENAAAAQRAMDAIVLDTPRAVFVNDATIPFHATQTDVGRLLGLCAGAQRTVLNALDSTELGTTDPITHREQEVLAILRAWCHREVRLPTENPIG